ncbi:hypothetical protein ACFSPU_12390 [Haoranjiania flava]|uniref:Uncharacterized protein n=1 Tax=Haoranjiania flava TaxID=1856322 RepID=A0AAE3INU6_9BACT|nr:hypothetical protein [Haoranjiania flava]MCU7695530.1 hypothetical protein [Haoranjiania flava]
MKKITFIMALLVSFSIVNFSAKAEDVIFRKDNIGDTAATKKLNNFTLNGLAYNKKFSLNVKKETPKQYFRNYNSFDISTKRPDYIQSVLMRKGNTIQAIPLYIYTLPF